MAWLRYVTNGRFDLEVALSCQLTQYISYVSSYSSVWILTGMTIEKTFNILSPLKAKNICTVKSAKIVCISIIAFWACAYSFLIFTIKKHEDGGKSYCQFDFDRVPQNFSHFYTIIDVFIYSLLPSTLILIANITIVVKVIQAKYHSNVQSMNTLSKVSVTTTIMLVTISVAFITLTLPSCVIFILYHLGKITNDKIVSMAAIPYLMNHSINAALLTLVAPKFREEMKKFFMSCCKGVRVGPLSSQGTTSFDVKSSETQGVKHDGCSTSK